MVRYTSTMAFLIIVVLFILSCFSLWLDRRKDHLWDEQGLEEHRHLSNPGPGYRILERPELFDWEQEGL
jgi:hypothetical protein